jgi:hypothetical protein
VVHRLFGRGYGHGRDPRWATALTFLIALVGVLIGDLNLSAPILTMFFLTSYGLLNISAALEGCIGSPSWRPALRVHWGLALLGTFGCFAVMFMINPGAMFIAAFVVAGVYLLRQRRSQCANWGDMRYGILRMSPQWCVSSPTLMSGGGASANMLA